MADQPLLRLRSYQHLTGYIAELLAQAGKFPLGYFHNPQGPVMVCVALALPHMIKNL